MRILAATGLLLLLGVSLSADDPCALLGLKEPYRGSVGGGQCGNFGQNPDGFNDSELLARIINNQKAEIVALNSAIDGLTKAVASLESTSKNLVAADQKWQADTLNTTIAAVDKVPATLAAEKSLQDVLVAAIKDKLLKDPAFIEAVKNAP